MTSCSPHRNPSRVLQLRNWCFSIVHLLFFIAILVAFHLPIVFARVFLGFSLYDRVISALNWCLMINVRMCAGTFDVQYPPNFERRGSAIFIANHQSMYDIPFFSWYLRKFHPRFVAKKELQRFLPSISFALRHGRHILIDRADPRSALQVLREGAQALATHGFSVVIFPEGTRARSGEMRRFKTSGVEALLEGIPDARIFPVCIDGTWKYVKNNLLPIPFGVDIAFHVLPEISRDQRSPEEIVAIAYTVIENELSKIRSQ